MNVSKTYQYFTHAWLCYESFILLHLGFNKTTNFSSPFFVKRYVYLKLLHLPLHHHLNEETTSTLIKKTTKLKGTSH